MIRVDVESIIMASGNIPSVIVLRERGTSSKSEAPRRALSIQIGAYEAAAISQGIDGDRSSRPITHDLFTATLRDLDVRVVRAEVNRVEPPLFYAQLVVADPVGSEHALDARPSDAIALAVRSNAPIYVEDDVMNRASSFSFHSAESAEEEFERFDQFVQTLSPDDF